MKAIKKDSTGSILIDTEKGFKLWVDVWQDGTELLADWNKYIFNLDCPLDVKIRGFQNDNDNFDLATSLAVEYYENNRH
tara:strand:+ start:676 stop:912 length:237 start_codon:yes stop_codon:yes gene_type:complete